MSPSHIIIQRCILRQVSLLLDACVQYKAASPHLAAVHYVDASLSLRVYPRGCCYAEVSPLSLIFYIWN